MCKGAGGKKRESLVGGTIRVQMSLTSLYGAATATLFSALSLNYLLTGILYKMLFPVILKLINLR